MHAYFHVKWKLTDTVNYIKQIRNHLFDVCVDLVPNTLSTDISEPLPGSDLVFSSIWSRGWEKEVQSGFSFKLTLYPALGCVHVNND